MKTNLFRVREKKKKKIIIEEEKYKNPLILFFLRHKSFILMSIGLILICIMLISVGLAFSLFRNTGDFDITYIEGDEIIKPNQDPSINDDDIMEELTGVRTEGVVILTDRFMTNNGDIVTYYSDGISIVVKADGNIYKVFSNDKGEYGVDRDGNFIDGFIKGKLSSRSETLDDNTVITYYSDGTAQVEHNNIIVYVRDSDNIEVDGSSLDEIVPSGVSIESSNSNKSNVNVTKFSDGTYLINSNGNEYLVNKNSKITDTDNYIGYDKNNSFAVIEEKKLLDNNTITYFEDGSCVITDSTGKNIYVNKSGDVVIKKDKIYEIISNKEGYSTYNKRCSDGKVVTYYDNGAAVITEVNGDKTYIEDSGNIIYGVNGNIESIREEGSEVESAGKLETGEKVTNFENGKSEIINKDGTSYITDSTNIKLVEDEEEKPEEPEEEPEEEPDKEGEGDGSGGGKVDTSGIYISDAEHEYNDSKSIETTTFIIKNKETSTKRFRIVIEEVSDYSKYNTDRLDPQFVKFQAVIGGDYVASTKLTNNIWIDSDGSVNYVIYDGEVKAKSTVDVNLLLNVDYAPLDNSYQDKGFIGTIKVYLITDDE